MSIFREGGDVMAEIRVTPWDEKGGREVLVNGISIPDVIDVSVFVRGGCADEVSLTIRADSFQSAERER